MTGTVLGLPDLLHWRSSRRHAGPPAIEHDRSAADQDVAIALGGSRGVHDQGDFTVVVSVRKLVQVFYDELWNAWDDARSGLGRCEGCSTGAVPHAAVDAVGDGAATLAVWEPPGRTITSRA
jgi:hypothetical protein